MKFFIIIDINLFLFAMNQRSQNRRNKRFPAIHWTRSWGISKSGEIGKRDIRRISWWLRYYTRPVREISNSERKAFFDFQRREWTEWTLTLGKVDERFESCSFRYSSVSLKFSRNRRWFAQRSRWFVFSPCDLAVSFSTGRYNISPVTGFEMVV